MMKTLIFYLAITNIADGILTLIGLELFLIVEGNPLMAILYDTHPLLFISLKIGLSFCLLCLLFFKTLHKKKLINSLLVFSSAAYTVIMVFHVNWIVAMFSI